MRFLYNFLAYLLLLPYTVYWLVRALLNSAYRPKLGQRFGIGHPRLRQSIWIHAVSVGEVVAAAPLVRALRRRYPALPLLVTTVTPTGAARVRMLFRDDVYHSYIPFETPLSVNAFYLAPTVVGPIECRVQLVREFHQNRSTATASCCHCSKKRCHMAS